MGGNGYKGILMGRSVCGCLYLNTMVEIAVRVVKKQSIKPIVVMINSKLLVTKMVMDIIPCVTMDLIGRPFLLYFTKKEKKG